jgi:MoxR-like ATPase
MREYVEQILQEVRKVIIGKDDVVRKVMMCLLASGHMLMEDVPGVGKTTLALAFARALDLETKRVQFTSDTVPSDVVGVSTPDKATGEFVYKPGAIMTNILLADEINRTSSKTQSALLEAMEEQNVTVDGKTYPLPSPFIVLATQNPVGASGTQMLPDSQLDRFLVRVSMGYPDFESQVSILKDRQDSNPLDTVKSVVTRATLRELIAATTQVHIADSVYAYVTTLAEATRNHPMITLGVSPRGALSLCRIARAKAFISGRDYVVPEDVAEVAPDVYAHRLILGSKARFGEVTANTLLAEILEQTPMPVVKDLN